MEIQYLYNILKSLFYCLTVTGAILELLTQYKHVCKIIFQSLTKMKDRKIREARKRTGGGPVPPSLKDWEEIGKTVCLLSICYFRTF
jgi:hypothetical protein